MTSSAPAPSIPFDLTDSDKLNLLAGDANFHPHTWEELKQIIATNNLSILKRKPSDLLRYIEWTNRTKAAYGDMTSFVCQERLGWVPLPCSSSSPDTTSGDNSTGPVFEVRNRALFADREDYKILPNDWPYGVEPGIRHLVVWMKYRIPVQEEPEAEGYLTPESKAKIAAFVEGVFGGRAGEGGDNVMWFKNWTGLQSVRGLEHFHVLVRGAGREEWGQWDGRGGMK